MAVVSSYLEIAFFGAMTSETYWQCVVGFVAWVKEMAQPQAVIIEVNLGYNFNNILNDTGESNGSNASSDFTA